VTITALAVVFALAYVLVLRPADEQPSPRVRAVAGLAVWTLEDVAGRRLSERGPFAVAAGPGFVRQAAAPRPTAAAPRSPLDYAGLAAVVRSAVEDGEGDVGVKPLEHEGRRLWRAAMTFRHALVQLVVDQESGVVTWCATQATGEAGLPREEYEVTRIRYSGPPGAAPTRGAASTAPPTPAASRPATAASPAPVEERLVVPADTPGTRYFESLAAASAAAGFVPVASTLAPDGYRLAAAGVSDGRSIGGFRAAPSRRARRLDLLYVRDLSAFTVSQLPMTDISAGRVASAAADAGSLAYESAPVQYGTFAGAQAQTWFSPRGPSMLLAGNGYGVVVWGGLTRGELIALSEGFAPLD
jgi:hypothetical protein